MSREVFQISEGHSGYLDILLDYGFMGLAIVFFYLISSCARAAAGTTRDGWWHTFWFCYLVMVILHNTTESSLNTMATQMTATLLMVSVGLTNDSRGAAAPQLASPG